jgi:hypothetical protein
MLISFLGRPRSTRARDKLGPWLPGLGLVLSGAVLSWFIYPSWGDFLDCREITRDGRDQIVVGEVGLAPAADPNTAELARRRLHHRLRQQLADLKSSLGRDIYDVRCPGHAPRTADYTEAIVARRYSYGVLLEVWGVAAGSDAAITYALLPLLPPVRQGTNTGGFYELGYHIASQGSIADVFAEAVELRAFTALSAGLRTLTEARRMRRSELYDRAYATLCRADSLLGEAERRASSDGPTAADWAALRNLARDRANAARVDAIATASGGGGTLARPPAGVSVGDCGVSPPDPLPPTWTSGGSAQ